MYKATSIFAYTSRLKRAAGWSESWYIDGTLSDVRNGLEAIEKKRAGLLPATVAIIGQRLQKITNLQTGRGKSVTSRDTWPGIIQGGAQDIPQMAMLCQCQAQDLDNTKRFTLRGMPDLDVVEGDFEDATQYQVAFNAFAVQLYARARIRCYDLGQPQINVLSVGSDGTFILQADLAFDVGDFITLLRVKDIYGRAVKGTFYINAKGSARTGTFFGWKGFVVGQSGSARKRVFVYPRIQDKSLQLVKAVTRKVGRPFDVYRGRVRAAQR